MHEEEGNRVLDFAPLMNVVNVQCAKALDIDVAREHGQLVDLRFSLAPVEFVFPVRDEPSHVVKRSAIVPPRAIEFIWQACQMEFLTQQIQVGLGNRELERLLCRCRGCHDCRRGRGQSACYPTAWMMPTWLLKYCT